MPEYPCQSRPDLFEPFVAPGESMALRGLRLVNIQAMCDKCPIRQQCEAQGRAAELPRGVWGGKVLTRFDQPKKKRRRRR